VFQWAARAVAGFLKSRASLVAENLCLRQQLVVLRRRHPRPRLTDADRRFWILARCWFRGWRQTLLIVKPDGHCLASEGVEGVLALEVACASE